MAFEQKPNSGTLFKNDRKTKDNQPDYKGKLNVEGTLYDIAAWVKEGKRGKFLSLRISEPQPGGRLGSQIERDSDDIPF